MSNCSRRSEASEATHSLKLASERKETVFLLGSTLNGPTSKIFIFLPGRVCFKATLACSVPAVGCEEVAFHHANGSSSTQRTSRETCMADAQNCETGGSSIQYMVLVPASGRSAYL